MSYRNCEKCAERTGYPHYFRSLRKLKTHIKDCHPKERKKSWRPRTPDSVRAAVLKRDKNRCIDCKSREYLHVHHKVHRSDGGTDEMDNLETLCDVCHAERHRGETIYSIMIKSLFKQKVV